MTPKQERELRHAVGFGLPIFAGAVERLFAVLDAERAKTKRMAAAIRRMQLHVNGVTGDGTTKLLRESVQAIGDEALAEERR